MRLYTDCGFTDNVKLYMRMGYQVDRQEVHSQLGMAVFMCRLPPRLAAAAD